MTEITGQLLSTRLQQLAGESAGHTNESAQYEITFDNPIDIDANNIQLIYCLENLCWAILDDGPGIENIDNLWGTGDRLKIKDGDKIGNKVAGELASATFFSPSRVMYLSRCPSSTGRIHQQLNAQMDAMIKTVKSSIDLTSANDMICKGPNRLVRKPEPDFDKFDNDNVALIKELFKNNAHILNYFETDCPGMLKVFKYEESNKDKFMKLMEELPRIMDKVEFITYNTLKVFRGEKTFEYMDVEGTSRIINKETCKHCILGRGAVLKDDDEEYWIQDDLFGKLGKKVLYLSNTIYEYQKITYNKCSIINYDEEDEFLVGETKKIYLGAKGLSMESIHRICNDENKKAEFPILLSFVGKDEAESQKIIMNETTLESLKQVYIYYQGRFIAKCKVPIAGLQERSLPNFRIIIPLNKDTVDLIQIQAQKSSISLNTANPIIIKTIEEMIKPIINKYSSQNNAGEIIKDGISSWNQHKDDILRVLGVSIPFPPKPLTPSATIASAISATPIASATIASPSIAIAGPSKPIAPSHSRGPPNVALNQSQTISYLKRLKIKLKDHYKTKASKKKLYTIINSIEKEIVIDDDIMMDKIDNLIEMLKSKSENEIIKNASQLHDL